MCSPSPTTHTPSVGTPHSVLTSALSLRSVWLWIAVLGVLTGSQQLPGAETTDALTDARLTLEKWVETRQQISKTRTDWQSDKETLEQTIQLFDRELQKVSDDLSKLSTNNVQVEKERKLAEASLKASEESLERTRQFASEFEKQILQLVPRLPAPLQEILKGPLNKLPSSSTNTTQSAPERILNVVSILGELEKFNHAVTIFSEKRKNPKGDEVSVETVYVGLGAAYYVNEGGDVAGLGSPGVNGWEWTHQPDLAGRVREVIRIYKNERPAKFILLPVVIK